MTDLVQRLRQEGRDEDDEVTSSNCLEAADRIEAQDSAISQFVECRHADWKLIQELKVALRTIADTDTRHGSVAHELRNIARRALEGK